MEYMESKMQDHLEASMSQAEECYNRIGNLENELELAWAIIANAGGGNWELESQEWQEAAAKWRDRYHALVTPNDLKISDAQGLAQDLPDESEWKVSDFMGSMNTQKQVL